MTLFSTIIPCYNRQHHIAATIDSVLSQTEPTEIIVVDDGSTDDSLKVLERYHDRITVIRQQNAGPGAARNFGASRASGEYFCFLDSDDLWFPWTLKTYRSMIESANRPSVIATEPFPFTDPPTVGTVKQDPLESAVFADFFASPMAWYQPSGMAVRRDAFQQTDGFTHAACEDADLWLRLGTAPGFVKARRPLCFAYRIHDGGLSSSRTVNSRIERLIDEERAGHYPGGDSRAAQRRAFISLNIRPMSVSDARTGHARGALRLYRRTFWWNVRLMRWKYLCLLPVIALISYIRRRLRGSAR